MQHIPIWQMLIAGAVVAIVLLWMRPGMKAAFEQSRQAKQKDWAGVLLPLAAVILFVILLISVVHK
jgi:uncharacterized membrane protein YedE/YeeE